jgi:hypothetical protein
MEQVWLYFTLHQLFHVLGSIMERVTTRELFGFSRENLDSQSMAATMDACMQSSELWHIYLLKKEWIENV